MTNSFFIKFVVPYTIDFLVFSLLAFLCCIGSLDLPSGFQNLENSSRISLPLPLTCLCRIIRFFSFCAVITPNPIGFLLGELDTREMKVKLTPTTLDHLICFWSIASVAVSIARVVICRRLSLLTCWWSNLCRFSSHFFWRLTDSQSRLGIISHIL